MHKIKKARNGFTKAHRNLRRARHLYALFIRKQCESDIFGGMLRKCTIRAQKSGLYKTENLKDIRWSLLRKFWRLNPRYSLMHRGWFLYIEAYKWEWHGRRKLWSDLGKTNAPKGPIRVGKSA